jgi:Tfp pilus assembly PilM family ATPase
LTRESAAHLAAEFKMVLSFYLAELFQEGITIPPSHIILSGQHASNTFLQEALSRQISANIMLPPFLDGYFQCSPGVEPARPELFLIPLGLAVE